MKWLLEDFDPDNSINRLAEAVKKRDFDVEHLKYEPFESGDYSRFKNERDVIFFGSINLGVQLQREYPHWKPGVILNTRKLEFMSCALHWFTNMLNTGTVSTSYRHFKIDWPAVGSLFGGKFFIRPNSPLKPFSGTVFDLGKFGDLDHIQEAVDHLGFYMDDGQSEIVLIDKVQPIEKEWRLVVTDRYEIITGCLYRKDGKSVREPEYPEELNRFVAELNTGIAPDRLFMLDIALVTDVGYKIIEANGFSCSGLYACDMEKIIDAVLAARLP